MDQKGGIRNESQSKQRKVQDTRKGAKCKQGRSPHVNIE